MKKVIPQEDWLESWKYSYQYDLLEVYDDFSDRGYAYAYAIRRKHTLDLIKKTAPQNAKILDVAAGQGNFTLSLAELGYEVTWNDLRRELADYVELKREKGLVHYVAGDIFTQCFDNYFDVVLITEIIEHVAHPDEFLRKVFQLVKPSGYIIMTTPNGGYFQNSLPKFSDHPDPSQFEALQFQPNAEGHIFLLHLDEIKTMACQSGLVVLETRLFTNTLTRGYLKLSFLLKYLPFFLINQCERLMSLLPLSLQKKLHLTIAVVLQRPQS